MKITMIMKSNKIFPSLLIALSALFASCSKDGSQPTSEGKSPGTQKISFSAELPDPATGEDGARTTLADNGRDVKWSATDVISVFPQGGTTPNPFTTDANSIAGNEAFFTGAAPVNTKYFAIYPHNAGNSFNGTSSFTTTLQTEQSAMLGTYADNTSISVATLDGYNATSNRRFKFKNATGLLKIEFSLDPSLAGKEITEIRLMTNPNTSGVRPNLSGTATVTAGTTSVRPTSRITSGVSYISLSNGGAAIAPTSDGKGYYMVVPTENTGLSFSLAFMTSDGEGIIKKVNAQRPFSSNKIKSIKVNIDRLETMMLTNVPLINAIARRAPIPFVREADGTMNYFKNIEAIEKATVLNELNNTELTSLRELEYYSGLTNISLINVPNLTGDVSITQNKELKYITIQNTGITKLSLDNINKVSRIDISSNSSLTATKVVTPASIDLDVNNNKQLTSLDITGMPNLNRLRAYSNALESVDLSRNTKMTSVNLMGNKLTSFDVSTNTELTNVVLSNNPTLQGNVDLTNNPKVGNIILDDSRGVTSISLAQNSLLKKIEARRTGLTSLDLSTAKDVETIYLDAASNLTNIVGLNALPKLKLLHANGTALQSVDVSGSPLLAELVLYGARISTLDITNNPQLVGSAPRLQVGKQTTGTITVTMTATQKANFSSTDNNVNVNVVVQ